MAKLKKNERIARSGKINVLSQRFIPAPTLSKQQMILNEMFGGGERTWGTCKNVAIINHDLDNPNGMGLIKTGDRGATGRLFGVR